MGARTVRHLLGLSSVVVALAAGPVLQPPVTRAPQTMVPAAARGGGLNVAPAPRVRPALGVAPRPQFQLGQQTVRVDPKEPGVHAVRSMPPQNFDPAVRQRTVREFYAKQAAAGTAAANVPVKAVGPYRREFVAWTRYWALRDRAWWAWNNYAYFDRVLWAQWMLDREFAALMAGYDASGRARVLGFIPEQYAASPAEVIYNDDYIEAVYNPVYTTPSIVVDGSTGGRLGNLVEGVPRTFGRQNKTIASVAKHGLGLQFVSIPAGFDPTYQVEVKRDGELFIFGPKQTPLTDGLGTDATNWHPVHDVVVGSGIDVVYQRHVAAGEHIRLHGVEWSIASEQIELLNTATPAARTAVSLVDAELGQIVKQDAPVFDTAPELKDYLRIAMGAEQAMLTPLGNVNDEKVGLFYAALAKTQKVCLAATSGSVDHRLTASGTDLLRQVRGLAESMGEVDELRDPSVEPTPALATSTDADASRVTMPPEPVPSTSSGVPRAATPGRRVDLLASVDVNRDMVSGTWTSVGRTLVCDGPTGVHKALEFTYVPPAEYDYEVAFVESGTLRSEDLICAVGDRQFPWVVGDLNGTLCRLGLFGRGGSTARTTLIADQRYTTLVQVRRDGVHAYLDGRELAHVDTDYGNVTLPRGLKLRATNTLGLSFACEHTTVESAIVTEVGDGGPLSPAPPTRAPTMVAPPPMMSNGSGTPDPTPTTPDGAVSGTLCVRLMCDLAHGDALGVYLNGARIGLMDQDTINGTLHIPATLRAGDVLGFRASDRFLNHSLRFAFVGPDGAPLFASRASSTVVREQYNSRAPFPKSLLVGDVARVGRCAMGENQAWAQQRLPDTAEWIALPKPNTLYDIATTVPDLRAALGQPGATAPVPSSPTAPGVRPGRTRTVPNLVDALGPVGSVWIPFANNNLQAGQSLTVLSVDSTTVDFRYGGADGSTSRWTFEVSPTGQIRQTSDGVIHAPANAAVVSDLQVHIILSGNHLLVRGSRRLDGVPNRVSLTLVREP